MTSGIALEEVARFDHNCAIILCGCNITGRVLLDGSENMRRTYLPDIVKGTCILAFAAMESEAGSDIRAIRTIAKRVEDTYVVAGEKSMITFAEIAQGFVVLVKTDEENKEGISCIFVEANRTGIEIQRLQGFGWRATKWGNIAFSDVQVPAENLIGEKNGALSMLKTTVQEQRAFTGLIALGTAKQALEEAVEYAKIPQGFRKAIGKIRRHTIQISGGFYLA